MKAGPPVRLAPGIRALLTWLCVAGVFGAALWVVREHTSPLDDPNAADERAGYLDAVGPRSIAPLVTISAPAAGKVTVVFFVRTAQQRPLISALSKSKSLPAHAEGVVVGGRANLMDNDVASVTDVDAALARGYGMPIPRDGGYPVGYAIVGPDRTIRYRTLDPALARHLDEVRTMLAALT